MDKNIVLYDGDCGFCNYWVQWILKRDHANQFRFASLQGVYGQKFLRENNLPNENFDTVYIIKDGTYYSKLDAVAEIGLTLGKIYSILGILKFIPNLISDPVYMLISNNRKKLGFESCMLPTPEERKKFINDH